MTYHCLRELGPKHLGLKIEAKRLGEMTWWEGGGGGGGGHETSCGRNVLLSLIMDHLILLQIVCAKKYVTYAALKSSL